LHDRVAFSNILERGDGSQASHLHHCQQARADFQPEVILETMLQQRVPEMKHEIDAEIEAETALEKATGKPDFALRMVAWMAVGITIDLEQMK
jgi:hypothetical protein